MKLLIYMPAYNEADSIQPVLAALPKTLPPFHCIETLVVNDGSSDCTAELARNSGAAVVNHFQNRGVGAAFQSAVQYALEQNADMLIGMDADGQFDPAEIPVLLGPILRQQADMVVGNRFAGGKPLHMPSIKFWGNQKVASLIGWICGQGFTDVSCGFRAYSREALYRLNTFAHFTYTHESILSLIYQGLRVVELPIHVRYDPERKSRVAGSISRYFFQTSKIILRVLLDYRPMRVFGGLGSGFVLLGLLMELFLLGYYALYQSFTPYKSVGFVGLGLITFGMLVLVIALVADMINRLRLTQDRLLYELKKTRYGK